MKQQSFINFAVAIFLSVVAAPASSASDESRSGRNAIVNRPHVLIVIIGGGTTNELEMQEWSSLARCEEARKIIVATGKSIEIARCQPQ